VNILMLLVAVLGSICISNSVYILVEGRIREGISRSLFELTGGIVVSQNILIFFDIYRTQSKNLSSNLHMCFLIVLTILSLLYIFILTLHALNRGAEFDINPIEMFRNTTVISLIITLTTLALVYVI